MNKKFILFLPLILLLSVCLLLLLVCIKIQNKLPLHSLISPCRNSIKQIYLNRVKSSAQEISQRNLSLLNVWGSWCGYCQQEHPLLMEISKDVPIVGIDYRDKPQNGIAMLERMGNPFILTIDDSRGEFAMQLGVDGAPETYIVDEHGMIRYRHSGYMDRETWLTEIKPKLDELTKSKMKKLTRFLTALLLTFALFAHAEMVDTYAFKTKPIVLELLNWQNPYVVHNVRIRT